MTAFHAAFETALTGRFDALWPHLVPDDRTLGAIAVYRNTAIKGRIDALEANYPTVAQMVGPEWFRAAAREFVEGEPGDNPVLADYGVGFPDWLARFPPVEAMPYLGPMARLDRAWTEAHLSADAAVMAPNEAAGLGLALAGAPARLHPSVRLFWFDWTAPSLWLAHRDPGPDEDLVWRPGGEGLLIHRPEHEVRIRRLSRPEWAFLNAARHGRAFASAALAAQSAAAAQSTNSDCDVAALFGGLIALGVFQSLNEPDVAA